MTIHDGDFDSLPLCRSDQDRYWFAEGTHQRCYQWMGARRVITDGRAGVRFVLWAPNASRVTVVGDFNGWDGDQYPMSSHQQTGLWELFVPGLTAGALYQFQIYDRHGQPLPAKADPYALAIPRPGDSASMVADSADHTWQDQQWMRTRGQKQGRQRAVSIYEVHLGSWRRRPDDQGYLSYREFAESLIPYVKNLGFTHIQLMPVAEHPFDGSWGYQPIGLFAPTSRFGRAVDFKYLIDACHQAGLGVILDWVPGHFPTDAYGLGQFDGTALYEHEDPRRGFHPDWHTLIYNYDRREVVSYLLSNAHYWLAEYHIDGLRVDAVASMLYLDYSRNDGEWLPNERGGRENLGAVRLLQQVNRSIRDSFPDVMTFAEESTDWCGVTHEVDDGGLGFGFKWNMGWMNDTLRYLSRQPVHRQYHHNELTFGLTYAYSEHFVLPLSHDEVVHGKGSLINKMPGDQWQQFAQLRALFGFMWTHPGKKLLFQGGEFAQWREWNHDRSLDWFLLEQRQHRGVQQLVRDLNHLYRQYPALYVTDGEQEGFRWLVVDDNRNSVFAYWRQGEDISLLVICNFTPQVHEHYRLGVPCAGEYRECINTDSEYYNGSNVGNVGAVLAEPQSAHGYAASIAVRLPPLATLVFEYQHRGER